MKSKRTGIQIMQDSDGNVDLSVNDGHLTTGDTMYQNQWLILNSHKGEWKENPKTGAGISDMANDNDTSEWKRKIREELERDDMEIEKLTLDMQKSTFELKADYKQ